MEATDLTGCYARALYLPQAPSGAERPAMVQPRFDPSGSVKFDLGRGQVTVDGSSDRVLVPVDALLTLCTSAGEAALRDFGRRLGGEAGQRARSRIGSADKAGIEAVVEHLGGDLALMGLGSLGVERWGRALVMTVDGSPLGAGGDPLLAAIVEGALQRAFGREASVVVLAREVTRVRLLVTSAAGADKARQFLAGGSSWGDVLTRLHEPGGRA